MNQEPTPQDTRHSSLTTELERASIRILVVDDDAVICNLLREILIREGYSLDTAHNGLEAVSKIEAGDYDLVITDLVMPGLGGVDVLRAAKRKSLNTDVIVMTGYASVDTAIRSIRLGATDYVTKPFNIDHLRVLVAKTVEVRKLLQKAEEAEAIKQAAAVDLETGLYNSPLFQDVCELELAAARRSKQPLSLAILLLQPTPDAASDAISSADISTFSQLLRSAARPNDVLARLGPNTFAVLMPDTDQADATLEAERLHEHIASSLSQLTILLATATFPYDAHDRPSLVQFAFQQLEYSKGKS